MGVGAAESIVDFRLINDLINSIATIFFEMIYMKCLI